MGTITTFDPSQPTDCVVGGRPYDSAVAEARFMLRAVGRNGQTVDDVRETIMARREDEEALLDGIIDEENRDYADEFRRALEHRRLVLIHFDRLLAKRGSELGARRRGEQPTERCCPDCGRAFRPMTDRQFETALKSHRKHALKHVAA